jgi:methyl-accepting chemotaxis protein
MFKNLTIKTRLIFVIVLLGLELVIGAAIGLVSLGHANDAMQSLYDQRLVRLGQLDTIVRTIHRNQLAVAESLTADPAAVPAMLDQVGANIALIDSTWKTYTAASLTGEEARLAGQFAEARARFVGEALRPTVAALRAQDLAGAGQLVHGKLGSYFVPVDHAIDSLIKVQLDEARRADAASRATFRIVRIVCLAGMAFGLVLAGFVGAMLIRGIVHPLEEAVQIAGGVAGGDLTRSIEVGAHDETGRLMQALREMNDGLAKIVRRVRGGTDTIATAAGQIAAGNLDLSARTEDQASSLEQTAASMEELTSTVKQNADNARQANALAMSASEVASKGGSVVAQVVSTMGAINTSATRIVDIIAVIDGIAFQTNILALNAAVEAARAGEQGRGFAVVASEVRNLAQRSAAAAKEIKALIDDSVDQVRHGSELVDAAGATMAEIVQSVDRVTGIMAEITAASLEQTAGIEQVNQAIAQMDQATQQNAALVEEASAAAQALQQEAEELARTVGTFRLAAQPVAQAPARVPRRVVQPRLASAGSDAWEAF